MINNLRDLYGPKTQEFEKYQYWSIYSSPVRIRSGFEDPRQVALRKQQNLRTGIERTIAELNGIIRQLREKKNDFASNEQQPHSTVPSVRNRDRVFIVHGSDGNAHVPAARLVEQLGFKASILSERATDGKTVIETLEAIEQEVDYAIVILSAEDVGVTRKDGTEKTRASQNVVLQLGFVWGALGRQNVCCICEDIELPSDLHGLRTISAADDSWKYKLAKNLKSAGFAVDMNLIS